MLVALEVLKRARTIRERTIHGLHRACRSGKQSGIIPYGYDVDGDGRLCVVEDEAEIVRGIISNIAGAGQRFESARPLYILS